MLDLDRFKYVNDIYGHYAGDRLLKYVAQLLKASFRKTDTVFRLGGDEFGVFISHCYDVDAIQRKLNEIQLEYEKKVTENYPESGSSICFGGIYTSDMHNFTDLYQSADKVLYEAKRTRKGTCIIKAL